MKPFFARLHEIARPAAAFAAIFLFLPPTPQARAATVLSNDTLIAQFDARGLVQLIDARSGQTLPLARDSATLTVNGEDLAAPGLNPKGTRRHQDSLSYFYEAGVSRLEVMYELRPGWHFLSKRLALTLPPRATGRVNAVEPFRAELGRPVTHEQKGSSASGAVFLDLGGASGAHVFLALQNPFLKWERTDQRVSMSYAADLEWRAAYGPFESDRVCLGFYWPSGVQFPLRDLREWKYVREPERAFDDQPKLDLAAFDALSRCVDAFVLNSPSRSLRLHVPWCENDYQIDVATPAGRAEWKRILDQCAAVGCRNSLFTPANSALAPLRDNTDAWGWENCLWLGLGQKIRRGEWNIAKDPIPPSIQEMLDYAKSKQVKLVGYIYPTLGWKQQPEWTAWCGGKTGGSIGADTGVRSFQDWFLDQLVAFHKRTGIAGYSFDHWFIGYEPTKDGKKPTSKYAQWFGCRRILQELRRRIPDVVVDGRQQYQWFGAWTWLAGSYPHPTTNDEQPGSFQNFPDLHFSRVSGDRQRWAAWFYHQEQFAPLGLVPGYMTHQTPRYDAQGRCVRDRAFQARDWDYLGWRYSVICSIGTAPRNHVVNLLPARDETEFKHFRREDQQWLRHWLDWTDQNRATLAHLRPIIGPPALGRIDGTAALVGDHGFVFLFNPNYRVLTAEFALDDGTGLTKGDYFFLRELYPQAGRLLGRPSGGPWRHGDQVVLPIKGPEALVLEVVPASSVKRPVLLNARGKATLEGQTLILSEVEGEMGRAAKLCVLLPAKGMVRNVILNGRDAHKGSFVDDKVFVQVSFAGAPFDHCQQVGAYDPNFSNHVFRAEFSVPQRVFAQLANRRKTWPIPYTQEELLATWRGSDRLLLYVPIAEPNDKWTVGLKLNGQPVEVKRAYSDVFPLSRGRTFTGFYADVSNLKPDTRYEVEVTLPDALQPGQFQGLFFENVETEFTTEIVR